MVALVPALMIGISLGLLAYWVFSLRLPEAGDVGTRRKHLPIGLKMALAYAHWLGRSALSLLPGGFARELEKKADRLALQADRPGQVTGIEVVGYTILVPFLTGVFMVVYWSALAPEYMVMAVMVSVGAGTVAPVLYVWDVRNTRSRRIRNAFPSALDLLSLTVEAGLDFTEGVRLLANRSIGLPVPVARRRHDYHLGKLFAELLADIQVGVPRTQALRKLEEKTGVPEIGSFATVLALADETGGSVALSLRQLASEMRNTRVMRAEEFIAKAPIKMLFPMALFLFPVIFVVIFGPIGLQLAENLRF
ncbi:MAG: type II secretion system F family protein [Planctomycetes bacterium]|nr:type II secretion system F family protein [Planctomycetota bacterium]